MTSISVIIPTHNRRDLVIRAVRSAFQQTQPPAQIVVVDDGSSDDTVECLQRLKTEIPCLQVVAQPASGAAAARNTGAAHSSSDVLLFLDSDDELLPEACEIFSRLLSNLDVGVACSAAEFVDESGRKTGASLPRALGPAYENVRGLFLAGTFAVRREWFENCGRFAPSCRSSQHTEFALRLVPRLVERGLTVAATDEPTVRVYTNARSHLRGSLENLLAGALYIIGHHGHQLQKSPRYFADWCSIAAVYAAKLGRFRETRALLARAIRLYPRKTANLARLMVACIPFVARRVWRPETIS